MSTVGAEPSNTRPVELIAEWQRLREADIYGVPWRKWGPYLAERAWGTVREDYSANGDAWSYFPLGASDFSGLPVERGRHGRHLRRPPASCAWPWRCGTATTPS